MLATFGVLQVFWSMIWFFLLFMWIMLVFRVFGDLFRDTETGGFAKVMWIVFIIVLPFLGVFVYLIARGNAMAQREVSAVQQQEQAARQYIREAAGTSSADELARLVELKNSGVIDDAEFAKMKAKIVG
ncbi:MAG: PLDc N-terminal domain-containing protein [Actinobacteria bacterium]|nr:PLDc N-terminal domain-containing protein [Actinomycetota bacterium]